MRHDLTTLNLVLAIEQTRSITRGAAQEPVDLGIEGVQLVPKPRCAAHKFELRLTGRAGRLRSDRCIRGSAQGGERGVHLIEQRARFGPLRQRERTPHRVLVRGVQRRRDHRTRMHVQSHTRTMTSQTGASHSCRIGRAGRTPAR